MSAKMTATLPRLLLGIDPQSALSLEDHLAVHGPMPVLDAGTRKRLRRQESPGGALVAEIERAGLRGRGGASFPAASKLRAVMAAAGKPIVVVNATEGEPASAKDRLLLQSLPHLVLDGAVLAAKAIGAEEAIVCVCETNADLHSVQRAIGERRCLREGVQLRFSVVPNGYISGQESALVHHLNGGPALPTFAPPMPFQRGVQGRPTLVCNAETLAHLAMIARQGAEWYRQLGTPSQPGSTLLTLSGPVARPGVYEIEHGACLSSLIDAAGGLSSTVRAVLIGGYAGTWIDVRAMHGVALSDEHLAPFGASVGAGVIALLSAEACPVAETARLTRWLADQSAGQCGPCVNGLQAIASTLAQVASATAGAGAAQNLARLIALTHGRGACRHPDGAVRLVQSATQVFGEELSDHAAHGSCTACGRQAEMPLPAWGNGAREERAKRTRGLTRSSSKLRVAARA
jgi:NADH:ubiquinone oxidoreductase subunit F (NADH-binding)